MGRRIARPATGRRTRIADPGVYKGLVDRTKAGVPMPIAAASVGISVRTFVGWLARGSAEQDRLDELVDAGVADPEPLPIEKPFLDLFRDIIQARGEAAVRNISNVQRAANGGFVTEETTKKYRDEDGNLVEETTIKRQPPDWRAAAWWLERQQGQHFGRDAVQVEVNGLPGAHPNGEDMDAVTDDLASRIAANIAALTGTPAQITTGPADDTSDIIDAEIDE